jgi:aspartate/methionine/tyrosine aminotransferase
VLQYGDHRGHAGLRTLVAGGGTGLDPDDVLLTAGAAAALFLAATALLRPGDHAIVVRPNYATNLETPRAIGANLEPVDLTHEDGWSLDPDRIRARMTSATRLVSVTTPHNPTGAVLEADVLVELTRIVEQWPDARLLVDETYRDLTYAGAPPTAAALGERVIAVSSLSKAYGMPGIRLGWLLTRDPLLREKLLAAKEQVVITGSVADEAIGYEALRRRDELLPAILADVRRAFESVRSWLEGSEVFEWVEPRGGAVCFPRFRAGIDADADVFHRALFEEHGTLVGRGRWFEQPDTSFRLGFGWPSPERLVEGLRALDLAAARAIDDHVR